MTGEGWTAFVQGLDEAGRFLENATAALSDVERADGYRALVRATNNLLGRFETDPDAPELTPFNGWRQKFFMDNPDYRYWITDISGDHSYRIRGNVGDSVYQSVTAYTGRGVADAAAVARVDTDGLRVDDDGRFELTVSATGASSGTHLQIPESTTSLWVRYVHRGPVPVHEGSCRITRTDSAGGPPAVPVPDRFDRGLARLGTTIAQIPRIFELSTEEDRRCPNTVRHWAAMAGGAAFTEPGIHYLRGAWSLAPDEALVIDGPLVACRHWNIVLYNRFLNSLDYRHRPVSRSGDTHDGRLSFVLSAEDPRVAGYHWLDTEGLPFGTFVMRFLQPAQAPSLPAARLVKTADLDPPT